MHALIIDDAADFRALIAHFIAVEWPDAKITEYDPVALGRPPQDFDWSRFDVVLLDFMLGVDDGLDYLREFRKVPALPPVIFMTGSGSEDVAVKAIKLGAADYLRKHDLSRRSLVEAIRDAISESRLAAGAGRRSAQVPGPGNADNASAEFTVLPSGSTAAGSIQINGYDLIRKIGEGGMAVVYLTRHRDSGQERVLKILDTRVSTDPEFLDRFIYEYGVISNISSPYVIRIYDQGFTNDHAYISMEHLPGGDLKERIRAGAIDAGRAIKIFTQLVQALKAVHGAGIVHRDLKPQNLMFRADGSLALLDFGVAKDLRAAQNLTQAGFVIGTPNYISPEQVQGGAADFRSDLYSTGAILYEMLTGAPPYSASDLAGLMYAHCHSPIPQLPAHLTEYQILIDRLLAKAPEDRYQSTDELLPGTTP